MGSGVDGKWMEGREGEEERKLWSVCKINEKLYLLTKTKEISVSLFPQHLLFMPQF